MNLLACFVLMNWSSCKKERFLNNTKNNRLRKMTEGDICGDFLSSFTLLLTVNKENSHGVKCISELEKPIE
jgi:hypothetical protein